MVQFGVQFSTAMCEMGELRHAWAQAEALGFDWISGQDHFYTNPPRRRRSRRQPLDSNAKKCVRVYILSTASARCGTMFLRRCSWHTPSKSDPFPPSGSPSFVTARARPSSARSFPKRAGQPGRCCVPATSGRLVAVYLDSQTNLEIGEEVNAPIAEAGELVNSSLPAGEVATTAHFGPIPGLGAAHDAIHGSARQKQPRTRSPLLGGLRPLDAGVERQSRIDSHRYFLSNFKTP